MGTVLKLKQCSNLGKVPAIGNIGSVFFSCWILFTVVVTCRISYPPTPILDLLSKCFFLGGGGREGMVNQKRVHIKA